MQGFPFASLPGMEEECASLLTEEVKESLSRGVLLALSGGADSVFLLYLLRYWQTELSFPLAAMHVHHHIRDEEADRDANFCETLTASLGVPFLLKHADVPKTAKELGKGEEETARLLRYRLLFEGAAEQGLSVVATAHHATDHAETVLLKLLRGGGTGALVGIRPRRSSLLRPLLPLTGQRIRQALSAASIPYREDTTNQNEAYRRNYVRRTVLPVLRELNPNLEEAFLRMSSNLLEDEQFLQDYANKTLQEIEKENGVSVDALSSLPEAIFFRVVRTLFYRVADPTLTLARQHVRLLRERLKLGGEFSLSFPGNVTALTQGGLLTLKILEEGEEPFAPFAVEEGTRELKNGLFFRAEKRGGEIFFRCYSNIHKIDTEAAISADIIQDGLWVRPRRPGDVFRKGGHRHSVKKHMSAERIPMLLRASWPLLCDGERVIWVPSPLSDKDKTVYIKGENG